VVKPLSVAALKIDAAVVVGVSVLLTAAWAASGVSNFWPGDTLIWFGAVPLAHAGLIAVQRRPTRWPITRGLLSQIVVSGVWWLSLVLVWLAGPTSSFWPAWVLLAVVVAAVVHLAVNKLLPGS